MRTLTSMRSRMPMPYYVSIKWGGLFGALFTSIGFFLLDVNVFDLDLAGKWPYFFAFLLLFISFTAPFISLKDFRNQSETRSTDFLTSFGISMCTYGTMILCILIWTSAVFLHDHARWGEPLNLIWDIPLIALCLAFIAILFSLIIGTLMTNNLLDN